MLLSDLLQSAALALKQDTVRDKTQFVRKGYSMEKVVAIPAAITLSTPSWFRDFSVSPQKRCKIPSPFNEFVMHEPQR